MKKLLLFFSISFLNVYRVLAQLQVTPYIGSAIQAYVQTNLIGSGITISNVTFTGANRQMGSFNATNTVLFTAQGMDKGLILSTGEAVTAIGPNTEPYACGVNGYVGNTNDDADLHQIANAKINDKAILQFDFVPVGNTIEFNYIFGSEEYPEFVGSGYNDAFGFFLSGPGISGSFSNSSINLAVIPNTSTPVTINTVNGTTNSSYYVYNGDPGNGTVVAPYKNDNKYIQYDGYTVRLTAKAQVQCGQTYHLKIAIGDGKDQSYDSGVFLQGGSLVSDKDIDVNTVTTTGNDTIVEGCSSANICFTRTNTTNAESIPITVSGSAINGVDYTQLPATVDFQAGQNKACLTITPIADGIVESKEDVQIDLQANNSCGGTVTVTSKVFIKDGPTVSVTKTDASCSGCDGTATASITGGTAPITYSWSSGATASNATALCGGSYTVTVKDANGCSINKTATINASSAPPAPTANGVTICTGNTATLTASGSNGGVYEWFSAASGGTALATGTNYTTPTLNSTTTYYVQIKENGCSGPRTAVTVNIGNALTVSAGSNTSICNGDNYTLTATPNGGSYTYTWDVSGNPGFSSQYNPTVTPTTTTTYSVTVKDNNGCVGSGVMTLTVNPIPTVNAITNVTVCDGANVAATTFSSNPNGATFSWANSNASIGLSASGTGNTPSFTASNASANPVTATITVTPTLGCAGTPSTYTITVNPTPAAPTSAGASVCANNSTTLTATAPGGTYEWFSSPNGGTALASGASYTTPALNANTTYYVQTTSNGCISPRTAVAVTIGGTLTASAGSNATICNGDSYTLSASPNGSGYTYTWDYLGNPNFSSIYNPSVTPTSTTTYSVTVKDNNGCVGSSVMTLTVNPIPTVNAITNVTVCNGANVAATTFSSNPNGATFSWTNSDASIGLLTSGTGNIPSFTANNTGSNVVTATVSVTPTLGCTGTPATYTITVNPAPTPPTAQGTTICANNTSVLTATAPGGTYEWFASSNGGTALASGASYSTPSLGSNTTYYVQTTVNGCVSSRTPVTVTTVNSPAVTLAPVSTKCNASCDGSISSAISGGTAPYTYSWASGETTNNLTGLCAGNYSLTVKDATGCSTLVNTTIVQPVALKIDSALTKDLFCNSANSGNATKGSINLYASGGTAPYQYSIDSGGTYAASNSFVGLNPGKYYVTIQDSKGCKLPYGNLLIKEPIALTLPKVVTNVTCNGGNNGQIAVAPQGGTSPYTYSWSLAGIGNAPIANQLSAGAVMVTVTDAKGCKQSEAINITQPNAVDYVTFSADVLSGCSPLLVHLTSTIDTALVSSWSWNFGNGVTANGATVSSTYSASKSYDVTLQITDKHGCSGALTKTNYIIVHPNPTANFTFMSDEITILNPIVSFTDLSHESITGWHWNFAQLATSIQQHPMYNFPNNDTASYPVTLSVKNTFGCKDSITKLVKVKGETVVFIPNAFTPNQDTNNETFGPKGYGVSNEEYAFLIYDRWGNLVFSSSTPFASWDGKIKGKPVPEDVYAWKLQYKSAFNGKRTEKIGTVSVIY